MIRVTAVAGNNDSRVRNCRVYCCADVLPTRVFTQPGPISDLWGFDRQTSLNRKSVSPVGAGFSPATVPEALHLLRERPAAGGVGFRCAKRTNTVGKCVNALQKLPRSGFVRCLYPAESPLGTVNPGP